MEKRQNFSRKRLAILDTIRGTKSHPTAEWVYQTLKPDYPDLSLGTVYRNIAQFKEDGLIITVGVVNGQERYDGNVQPHTHFVCTNCGAVIDIDESFLGEAENRLIAEKYSIVVDSHELVFYGKCSDCIVG